MMNTPHICLSNLWICLMFQTFPFFGVDPTILNEHGEELEGEAEGYLVSNITLYYLVSIITLYYLVSIITKLRAMVCNRCGKDGTLTVEDRRMPNLRTFNK